MAAYYKVVYRAALVCSDLLCSALLSSMPSVFSVQVPGSWQPQLIYCLPDGSVAVRGGAVH